jgi:CRP/FNR family cyclic AMP-dependent transcriptional regulator
MSLNLIKSDKLPSIGLLAGLTPKELDELNACGNTQTVASGEIIITEGEPQDRLYIVLKGRVQITCTIKGTQTVVGELRDGESFGEMAVLDPAQASATVQATVPTQIWTIARGDLARLVADNSGLGLKLIQGLAIGLVRRVRGLNREIPEGGGDASNWW